MGVTIEGVEISEVVKKLRTDVDFAERKIAALQDDIASLKQDLITLRGQIHSGGGGML